MIERRNSTPKKLFPNVSKQPVIKEETEDEKSIAASEKNKIIIEAKDIMKDTELVNNNTKNSLPESSNRIIFEKQKIKNPEVTHSVLSTSFQFHKEDIPNDSSVNTPKKKKPLSVVTTAKEASQQIQSPVMFSFKKKGSESYGKSDSGMIIEPENNVNNTLPANSVKKNINESTIIQDKKDNEDNILNSRHTMIDNKDKENENVIIEQKDNKEVVYEVPKPKKDDQITALVGTPENKDEVDDETGYKITEQKQLTAQALKKLNLFKGNMVGGAFSNMIVKTNKSSEEGSSSSSLNDSQKASSGLTINTEGSVPRTKSPQLNHSNKLQRKSSSNLITADHPSGLRTSQLDKSLSRGQRISSSGYYPQSPLTVTHHSYREDHNMKFPASTVLKNQNNKKYRQIHDPRKPLYIPAVLRDISETNITNEDIIKDQGPLEPSASNESDNYSNNDVISSQASLHSSSSFVRDSIQKYLPSFFNNNTNTLETDSLSVILQDAENTKIYCPKKTHWVPDSQRDACHYCNKIFTFWERKHHCRHCGDIYCQQHLRHWLYLDEDAQFVIGGGGLGALCKVCDSCLEEYEKLIGERSTFTKTAKKVEPYNNISNDMNKEKMGQSQKQTTFSNMRLPVSTVDAKANYRGIDAQMKGIEPEVLGSVVGSVPANWNWSSF